MSRWLRSSAERGKNIVEPKLIIHNLYKRKHIVIKRAKPSVLMSTWDTCLRTVVATNTIPSCTWLWWRIKVKDFNLQRSCDTQVYPTLVIWMALQTPLIVLTRSRINISVSKVPRVAEIFSWSLQVWCKTYANLCPSERPGKKSQGSLNDTGPSVWIIEPSHRLPLSIMET